MSTETRTTPTTPADGRPPARRRMTPMRKIALAGGITYLITFAASIPQLALFADVVDDPTGYISTPGSNAALLTGTWLEIVTAMSGVGTAVILYPVLKRVTRSAAIGLVATRVIEGTLILVGVLSLLSLVTLQQRYAGATGVEAEAVGVSGETLVAMRQWTFLLGPGVMAGFNDLFLGYALYRARLVPRIIPVIGLIGGPVILLSTTATIFGVWGQVSPPALLLALPVAAFEFSLGVWLVVKGFSSAAPTTTAPSLQHPEAVPVA